MQGVPLMAAVIQLLSLYVVFSLFYYGKACNGKKYPFKNVKGFFVVWKYETFCHLSGIVYLLALTEGDT